MTDRNRKRDNSAEPQKQRKLGERQKAEMFCVFVRDLEAFRRAVAKLRTSTMIPFEDSRYALLWECLLSFHAEHNELPDKAFLLAEIEAELQTVGDLLDDDDIDELTQVVNAAFKIKEKELPLKRRAALNYLKRYLGDLMVKSLREIVEVDFLRPKNLTQMLSRLQQQSAENDALNQADIDDPFPAGWTPAEAALLLEDTGFDPVNQFLGGGHAAGKVYQLLGPSGSCKTSLLTKLSVLYGKRLYRRWKKGGRKGPLPLVYYFCWEDFEALKVRALSYLSQIPFLRMTQDQHFVSSLDDSRMPGVELSESERFHLCLKTLNNNWRPIDMAPSEKSNRGGGMVPEMVEIIKNDLLAMENRRGHECRVGLIIIDYATVMVERHITLKELDPDRYKYHLLKGLTMDCRDNLARAFETPLWLAQQMNDEANALPSYKVGNRTQAQGCKTFADNADAVFILGRVDPATSLVLLAAEKSRYTKALPPKILQLRGDCFDLHDTQGTYEIDTVNRRFIKSSDKRGLVDASTFTKPNQNRRRPGLLFAETGDDEDDVQKLGS